MFEATIGAADDDPLEERTLNRNTRLALLLVTIFCPLPLHAWDGVDAESGAQVEIGKGNLVRPGQQIEFYDYEQSEYRQGQVQDVYRSGSSVQVELQDDDTGETRTLEMDGD